MPYINAINSTNKSTIASGCCLHNICILEEDIAADKEDDVWAPVAILPPGIFNNDGQERGILGRNAVMNRLARQRRY